MHNCGTRISHLRLDFKHDIIVTYNSSKKIGVTVYSVTY